MVNDDEAGKYKERGLTKSTVTTVASLVATILTELLLLSEVDETTAMNLTTNLATA